MRIPIRYLLFLIFLAHVCNLTADAADNVVEESWQSYHSKDKWHNSLKPKGKPGPSLALATDGKSDYSIVVSAKATSQAKKAAEQLQYWLKQITGVTLPITAEGTRLTEKSSIISIGWTKQLKQTEPAAVKKDLGDDGWGITATESKLFLWGGRTRGVINAVFALLEEDLGCRWYTDEHTRIPEMPTLTFAPVLRTYKPDLKLRDPFYSVSWDAEWSLRNRTNAPDGTVPEEYGGYIDYGSSGGTSPYIPHMFVHTFNSLVPPSKYFEEHPEYFMLDSDGQRSVRQLCTTNPEVVQLVTKRVKRFLAEQPHTEIVSVSKNDGGKTCLCKDCKLLDDAEGTNMAALLHLVNKVAEAIEHEHPHVVVSTLAYLETVKVPKTVRPRKNVVIRLCNDYVGSWRQPFTPAQQCEFGELVKAWSDAHDRIYIWDYVINFSHYMAPMPNMEVVAKNIRFLVDNNAEGIMTQGCYQSPGAEREWLRSWVFAKLMLYPSMNLNELMQDFIWGHYGKAAPAIAQYNELLKEQTEKYKDVLAKPEGGIRYKMDNPFLSKEFLKRASRIFDRAEKLAQDQAVLYRVQRMRLSIMYVKLMRGPKFVGNEYGEVLARFEKIARRTGVTHLREGKPDLDEKLQQWQKTWKDHNDK